MSSESAFEKYAVSGSAIFMAASSEEGDLRRKGLKETHSVLLAVLVEDVVRIRFGEVCRVGVRDLHGGIERVGRALLLRLSGDAHPVGPRLLRFLQHVERGCARGTVVPDAEVQILVGLRADALDGDPKPVLARVPDRHQNRYLRSATHCVTRLGKCESPAGSCRSISPAAVASKAIRTVVGVWLRCPAFGRACRSIFRGLRFYVNSV